MKRSAFYTRNGDEGYTGLLGEGRVAKEDPRIEAIGAVDEAGSALGLARAHAVSTEDAELIRLVQRDLYGLMAELAATPKNVERFRTIDDQRLAWLESQVDTVYASVDVPREFITPGDTIPGAYLDMARSIVRRAERRVAELFHQGAIDNANLLRYLNRLSSLCFVLEIREHTLAREKADSDPSSISLAKDDERE